MLEPRRTAAVLIVVVSFLTVSVVGVSRFFSVSCRSEAPCVTLSDLEDGAPLPEAIRIYGREGALIGEVAGPLRHALSAEDIPDLLGDAFVAAEDRRFWEHDGVDARGVVRAALRNLRGGDIGEGASTIPMQLVRTLWSDALRDVGPWRRKVIEARLAPRLVEELGHERVLTLYLNAIYLGNGIYGVERASRHYFGVGVDSLDVGQIATLVGITRSPEFYEPRRHPERALAVRRTVLDLLVRAGLVDTAEAEAAARGDLALALLAPGDSVSNGRTHFTAAVTRELRRVAPDLAGVPGLELHTTIDSLVQQSGERVLAEQLARIEEGRYGPFEAVDSTATLEGAALALDARTGAILAWVGGRDFVRSEFDRVDQARRQVGSLVKPILVASALDEGFGIIDMVSSDTVPIPTAQGGWLPADHVAESSLPLREALIRSSNRAAAHLGAALGLEAVAEVGAEVGLMGPIPALPSSSIGAFDASLLEMTGAYATFGNGGHRVRPYFLVRVEGPDGAVLWERADTAAANPRAVSERTAFIVLDAMRAVVDRGTGYAVRGAGYRGPAAGKTGTTNDGRDAWFVGLTPEMVAGMWIGFDQPREIVEGAGGGSLAAPAWGRWMEAVRRSPRPRDGAWIPPAGVERVWYDIETGQVLGLECRGRLEVGRHQEAWVAVGQYQRENCSGGGVPGWFERLWRTVVPRGNDRGGGR
jgi:penicillin-binding protein 1A